MSVATVLILVACILFLLAAIGWPNSSPVALGWLGAFFYALASVVGGFSG
jgi:hypothetical protein